MAAAAGKDGSVDVGANTVAELSEWSLDVSQDLLESHSFGDDWKENIGGLREWSGSASGSWDMSDTNGQKALQDALLSTVATVSLTLNVNASNAYSGDAYITSINVGAAVDGKVEVTFNFQGNGSLSYS